MSKIVVKPRVDSKKTAAEGDFAIVFGKVLQEELLWGETICEDEGILEDLRAQGDCAAKDEGSYFAGLGEVDYEFF